MFMVAGKTVAKMKVGLEPDPPEVGVGIGEVIEQVLAEVRPAGLLVVDEGRGSGGGSA